MPVSRNLSLPPSIEGRKMKKRPENLHRCNSDILGASSIHKPKGIPLSNISRPNFLPTTNNINNNNDVEIDESEVKSNESNDQVADSLNDNEMGVDTTSTRGGTLSQPCLSLSTTVGATRIFPHLYLGSQKDVVDEDMMRANGITYVLNVSKTCTKPDFIDDNHFHRISVRDNYQEKMTPFIREAIDFIEKVRKSNQRVIVHCLAGVSRSATVAIAYVLHYLRIDFEDAYRFVKEKRPSISPNFNFLGQLMEFERTLRVSGHMNTKRTGSLSDGSDEDSHLKFNCSYNNEEAKDGSPSRTSLQLSILKSRPDCSPRVMPVTCTFQCPTPTITPCQTDNRVQTPTSSFCRRRNAPSLSKEAFTSVRNRNNSWNATADTPMPKHLNGKKTPDLLVDLHVTVSDTCRRLGSDGNELEAEEGATCDAETTLTAETFTSPSSVSTVFVRPSKSMDCSDAPPEPIDDTFAKPRTAPNTPVIDRFKNGKGFSWRPGQLMPPKPSRCHRRCASGGITSELLLAPFSMKRRIDAKAERSASIGDVSAGEQSMDVDSFVNLKRGASFSGTGPYYDHSEPSSRSPYKFMPISSRSPKILRKNFNLNLRSVYPHSNSSRGSTKSETSVLKMDSMVLSSPSAEKDGPLLFPDRDAKIPTSPATCPILISEPRFTEIDLPRSGSEASKFLSRPSFTYPSQHTITDASTGRPFMLSPGCEPGWRCKNRRQSADSGYLSSQASSQSSSSFTSPTSNQSVFGSCASSQECFADHAADSETLTSAIGHTNTCHVEGAFVSRADDVTNSTPDPEGHKATVGRRAAVEIMSCS